MSIFSRIFGDANGRYINSLKPIVTQINALELQFRALSDADLKAKTDEFKKRLVDGASLDDLLPEAFAAVREASRRVSGKRHFDVQLMGGIVLHQGKIAEMRTGEGKTLVATLPAYLNALTGKGVHVVTVNDYLSRRDATWMGQIYDALGLTVGCINHDASYRYDSSHTTPTEDKERDVEGSFHVVHEFLRPVSRQDAYRADITYGTNNEYGFDYLRDNLVYDTRQLAQRQYDSHAFAIVDEVDSILIDEARTPLIISAPDTESGELYQAFARAVPRLVESEDYTIDEKFKTVSVTEAGIEKVEKQLGIPDIYAEGGVRYVHHLEQALRAHALYKRDREYVVKNGEVIIVDEFTGRLMPGRRWSEGLHQAVEAKEGVKIEKESRTLATITFQNYFRLYGKLSGMTGTARTSAEEFHKVYGLDVITVPTHKPMIRADGPDRIYKNQIGKFHAIVREIKERHEKGQPVLVGTVSIEKNELLASLLEQEGIPHNVLNAKNHEREAEIIAQTGRKGAVTVATNMAGRGVDIILGGNPPNEAEADAVRALGGLHVIGTERHDARRIDDQLRGRAGRQGDPGSSQFFISTEDDLVRVFGGDRLTRIMERLGVGEDDVIENRLVSRAIAQAQMQIEGQNFDTRKHVLEYDDVMNKHRGSIYKLRCEVLDSPDSKKKVLEYLTDTATRVVQFHAASESDEPDFAAMVVALRSLAPFSDVLESKLKDLGTREAVESYVRGEILNLYEAREQEIGADQMRQMEQMVLLRTIDELWMEHIEAMEHLRDSVRLRAYGQRDPLIEYKLEGQQMFERLMGSITTQVAGMIFKVNAAPQAPQKTVVEEHGPLSISSPETVTHTAAIPGESPKEPGRNDPCPCGSGKKFKKCGLLNTEEHQRLMKK